jgi:prepilin-type N-terminal cleavage/methylation domain-containing protein
MHLLTRRQSVRGFTLLELLIAMVVSAIMVSALLYGVVEIMGTNQRDASRSDTQRDMQMALDYMVRDLREAVYIYPGECLNTGNCSTVPTQHTGLLSYLPAGMNDANNLPVIAFWRVDPLPADTQALCRTNVANFATTLPGVPCVSRRMYTLVVYALNVENNTSIWRGKSRLVRYQLPQFTAGSAVTPGWVSPLTVEDGFKSWPFGLPKNAQTPVKMQAALPTNYTPGNLVLTDFVDNKPQGLRGAEAQLCPTNYSVTPPPAIATGGTSGFKSTLGFYACVQRPNAVGLNQEVLVYLKGNAAGRPGLPVTTAEIPFQLEARVLARGVAGKATGN